MGRDFTKEEERIVKEATDFIAMLDRLVFPNNPIKTIHWITGKPSDFDSMRSTMVTSADCYIGYNSPEQSPDGEEGYHIFCHEIDKWLEDRKKEPIVLMTKMLSGATFDQMPRLSEQEVIVGLAAHEVRHRAQSFLQFLYFSPEIIPALSDRYIRNVIGLLKHCLDNTSQPPGDYVREFDAKVVELIAQELFHFRKGGPGNIASLIRSGANEVRFF